MEQKVNVSEETARIVNLLREVKEFEAHYLGVVKETGKSFDDGDIEDCFRGLKNALLGLIEDSL